MVENPESCTAENVAAVLGLAGEMIGAIPDHRTRYADSDLTPLLQGLLQLRALAEGAALALLMEVDTRGLINASTATGARGWVRSVADEVEVPITTAEAGRWADLATECRRPDSVVLESACTSGRVPVTTGAVLAKELRAVRSQVPGELWDACADALTGYAAGGASPKELHHAVDVVITQYGDQDWIETRTREAHQRRVMTSFTPDKYGTYTAKITLDGDGVAQVEPVLAALSAPNPGPEGEPDLRSPGQRRADGLVAMCALVAAHQQVPEELAGIGNGCAQVIVTMDYERLRDATGYGMTIDGQPVSPTTVRRLACEAQIIPMILGSQSQPLDVGRGARLATPAQVRALRRRDKGCSFPGCGRPPSWTQAHHVKHWADGGPTTLDNLALLCQRHHTIVHRDHYTATITATSVSWHPPDSSPPLLH